MSNDPFGPNPNQNPTPFGAPPPNPYAPPTPQSYAQPYQPGFEFSPEDKPGQPWTMDYFGGFNRVMANPNWLTNILLNGVCGTFLVCIIVGPIVALGYSFVAAESWHRTRGERYPDFDFNRFVDYLVRGLGVFLIRFISGIAQAILSNIIFIPLQIALGILGNNQPDPAAMFAYLVIANSISFAIQMAVGLITWPMSLRGGISGDIGQAFNFSWALDFASKVWMELFLAMLVWGLVLFGLSLMGTAALCIGIIPAVGMLSLIDGWLSFQLYRIYLSRGGQPIPLKPFAF